MGCAEAAPAADASWGSSAAPSAASATSAPRQAVASHTRAARCAERDLAFGIVSSTRFTPPFMRQPENAGG